VENKEHGLGTETNFDFKYVPNYGSMSTELGEYNGGSKEQGIERRNLRTLIIASAFVGVASFFWMRTTWGLVGFAKTWWFSA